jgi:hypothetical protein
MPVDTAVQAEAGRGIRFEDAFGEFDARWIRSHLDRVQHGVAVSRDGERRS